MGFNSAFKGLISCWFSSCSIFISQVRDFRSFICLFIGRLFSCVLQLVKETDPFTLQNTRIVHRTVGARCWWRSWLRHSATNRKVAGSIPNDVIVIFSAALWPWGWLGSKGGRCVGLSTLPPLCADCLEIWEPQPPGTLKACSGL